MDAPEVARICHEINRAFCALMGDDSQVAWEDAPEWQRESAIAGVLHARDLGPEANPERQHEAWMADKAAAGWVHGPVKDAEAKTHPCMVPYAELPTAQLEIAHQ